jgi:hypothetical protein
MLIRLARKTFSHCIHSSWPQPFPHLLASKIGAVRREAPQRSAIRCQVAESAVGNENVVKPLLSLLVNSTP